MRRLFLTSILVMAVISIYGQTMTSTSWGIYQYDKTDEQWKPAEELSTVPVTINRGTICTTFHRGDSLIAEFVTLDVVYNNRRNNDDGIYTSAIGDDKDLNRVKELWFVTNTKHKMMSVRLFTRNSKKYMLAFDVSL